jgi:hypothetical protein
VTVPYVCIHVAVTGGRDFHPDDYPECVERFEALVRELRRAPAPSYLATIILLHGCCPAKGTRATDGPAAAFRGVDAWIDAWPTTKPWIYGETTGVGGTILFPPKQISIGWPGCGPERNKRMVDLADVLIAFPGGKGTEGCVKLAEKKGIPVYRIEVKP